MSNSINIIKANQLLLIKTGFNNTFSKNKPVSSSNNKISIYLSASKQLIYINVDILKIITKLVNIN
jgi:hypothetical protein